MNTNEQITLARKFAGRFRTSLQSEIATFVRVSEMYHTGASQTSDLIRDLTLLARAETLLAEADDKPVERVCEWVRLTHSGWYGPSCDNSEYKTHATTFCSHCGGRVKIKE